MRKGVRFIFRTLARICAALVALPFAGMELALRGMFRKDVAFNAFSQLMSLAPGTSGSFIRNAYYHYLLEYCPLGCGFSFGMQFTHSHVRVGRRVYIGCYSMIGYSDIGDDTMIADHVLVLSGAHQHGTSCGPFAYQQQPGEYRTVRIGRNVWIGSNAVIMNDVGDDCIIGAAAVVTKAIPAGSIAVGNPARIIRSREDAVSESVGHSAGNLDMECKGHARS